MFSVKLDNLQQLINAILVSYRNKSSQFLKAVKQMQNKIPSQNTIDKLNSLFAQNQLHYAEALARKVIKDFPKFAFGYKILGAILFNSGNFEESVIVNRIASKLSPNDAEIYSNLGIALHETNKLNEAIRNYLKALEINPNSADVLNNLGNAYYDFGNFEEALKACQKALDLKANFAETYNNIALIKFALGSFEESLFASSKAIELSQNFAKAYNNHANALQELGRYDDAIAYYARALELDSNFIAAYLNLSGILQLQNRYDESIQFLSKVIELAPNIAQPYNLLGKALFMVRDFNLALQIYAKAIELNPNFAEAYANIGNLFYDIGQFQDSINAYLKAVEINPQYIEVYSNLGNAFFKLEKYNDAFASFDKAIQIDANCHVAYANYANVLRDIGRFEESIEKGKKAVAIKDDYLIARSNILFTQHYIDNEFIEDRLQEAMRFGEIVADMAKTKYSNWLCEKAPKKLRVGLVSADFKTHPVGFFLENILANLKNSSIEIIGYFNSYQSDEVTARLQESILELKTVINLNDEELAGLIRNDGIHILFDLSGHTHGNRLSMFAYKPAPIQITWLGYFATTGLKEMDYIMGDSFVTPQHEEHHFVEKIARMPSIHHCFTPPMYDDLGVAPLPALKNGYITFGCLNNIAKANDSVLKIWAQILLQVPNSKLYLKSPQFDNEVFKNSIVDKFNAFGISSGRLIFGGKSSRVDFLRAYENIDIALDPFPYTGGTTNMETIWMGVPFITKKGNRFLSHMGESIAINASLQEFVAQDDSDYIAKAVYFSSNIDKLAKIRLNLRRQVIASPTYNAETFAKEFEKLLWKIWNSYLNITANIMIP